MSSGTENSRPYSTPNLARLGAVASLTQGMMMLDMIDLDLITGTIMSDNPMGMN